jgi:peptidoglycan L-alanyl-D-glutamate endopeptidase CwlK
VRLAEEAGFPVLVTCTWRSYQEQATLFAQGRTAPGRIVTHAKPGDSWHNFKPAYAFDVVFKKPGGGISWDGPWATLGALGRTLGLVWGGDWPGKKKDQPHFQWTGGLTLAHAREAYEKGSVV